MYTNILIPIALDHDSTVDQAFELAHRVMSEGARITLVTVVEDLPSYVAEYVTVQPASRVRREVENRLGGIARGHGDCEVAVMTGKPGVVIPELAEKTGADLIIVRSHRPGVEDYFLGSTASRIVRRAPCSVMVIRQSNG